MPTMKPRVQVTMTPHQFAIIKRLASLQGRSMGALVLDLVEAVEPVLERTVVLLERAKEASAGIREGLRLSAEAAEADTLPHVQAAIGRFDLFITEAEQQAAGAVGALRAPAAPGLVLSSTSDTRRRRPNPRTSNHGGQVRAKPLKKRKTGGK